LRDEYVFPETGEKFAAQIQARLTQGAYDAITDAHVFAQTLVADLYEVAIDLHLTVQYDPAWAERLAQPKPEGDAAPDFLRLVALRENNYGFRKVEQLAGNIGYIDLRMFIPSEYGGETAVAAMNWVANTDALIFDLRQNRGGNPSMIQLITSYLFPPEPKHLNSFYVRRANTSQQFWTLPHVPGRRMPDVPVYVLTSGRTGSAAEEFTYNLKNMRRATIVGETTIGAAHPTDFRAVGEGFVLGLPYGRAVNPITETNWEGVGVEPDIAVPAEDALKTAHLHALERLIAASPDEERTRRLQWDWQTVQSAYNPVLVDETILSRYVGEYGNREFRLENGAPVLKLKTHGTCYKLTPLTETLFAMDEGARIQLISEDGQMATTKMIVRYRDNPQETVIPRTE